MDCNRDDGLRNPSYNEERMNNKEIADRLRKAADELEGEPRYLCRCVKTCDISAYGTRGFKIECSIATNDVDIEMKYICISS